MVASTPTGQLASMTIFQIVDTDAKSCYNCQSKYRSRCPQGLMHNKVQHRLTGTWNWIVMGVICWVLLY